MTELATLPDCRLSEVLDLFLRNNVALNTQATYGRAIGLYFEWWVRMTPSTSHSIKPSTTEHI